MSANPGLKCDFTIKCPFCAYQPPQREFTCKCGHLFDPLLSNGTCPSCLKELEIYCDPANQGCGYTAFLEEWIDELPAIAKNMLNEVAQLLSEEYSARKNLESYFEYADGIFYSQIPFETATFKMGNSDCAILFSEFSTKELIDLFNTQAGIKALSKSECRIMFLLLQELVKRSIEFNFFKSYDKEKDLHKIVMNDPIELLNKKVALTREGRIKYL